MRILLTVVDRAELSVSTSPLCFQLLIQDHLLWIYINVLSKGIKICCILRYANAGKTPVSLPFLTFV